MNPGQFQVAGLALASAIIFHGRAATGWETLMGLFGLARFLPPAPGS